MSHDIRTPMNAIIGMTELAAVHIDDKERVADCLKKISLSSGHLMSLINNVLDMSKIERSRLILNRMRISLPCLTEQIAEIIKPQRAREALILSPYQRDCPQGVLRGFPAPEPDSHLICWAMHVNSHRKEAGSASAWRNADLPKRKAGFTTVLRSATPGGN